MHAQIRTRPARSPDDLAELLQVLFDAGINIEAAGGSDVEHGGEFAFGLAHDDGDEGPYADAVKVLKEAHYHPRFVRIKHCALDHQPGTLLACVQEAIQENQANGLKIKDVSVGAPDADGRIQVQIYSEAVPGG